MPVAVNCWFVPNAIDGFAGVMAIETRAALVTVSVVDPLTVPEVAAMTAAPGPTPVASPALEIVATPGCEERDVLTAAHLVYSGDAVRIPIDSRFPKDFSSVLVEGVDIAVPI